MFRSAAYYLYDGYLCRDIERVSSDLAKLRKTEQTAEVSHQGKSEKAFNHLFLLFFKNSNI